MNTTIPRPSAVVTYERDGRWGRVGVAGPTSDHVKSKLDAIVRGLVQLGYSFSVRQDGQ